jgi:predicted  nucleic acid-binding Zn-ribbon protein
MSATTRLVVHSITGSCPAHRVASQAPLQPLRLKRVKSVANAYKRLPMKKKSPKKINPLQKKIDELDKNFNKLMYDLNILKGQVEFLKTQDKDFLNARLEKLEKLFQWDLTKLNKPK